MQNLPGDFSLPNTSTPSEVVVSVGPLLKALLSLYVILIPADLIGIYGPLSLFKITCAILVPVIILLAISTKVSRTRDKSYVIFSSVLMIQIVCLLINAIFTSPDPSEELKLILVFVALAFQLKAFSIATGSLGTVRTANCLLWGFGLISIATLVAMFMGVATYSSSGRLAGLFRSSSTMGFFPAMMFCFAMGASRLEWISKTSSYLYSSVALTFLFLSGSRAGLVLPFVVLAVIVLFRIRSIRVRMIMAALVLILGSLTYLTIFETLGNLLLEIYDITDLSVAKRMGQFALDVCISARLEDLDESRAAINQEVLASVLDKFPFLGRGLETSLILTPYDIKPHNLFYYTLFEMGVVTFLTYTYCFVYAFYNGFCVAGDNIIRPIQQMIGIVLICSVWMAFKTPFFVQSSLYWMIWMLIWKTYLLRVKSSMMRSKIK